MNSKILEKVALLCSIIILLAAGWYWEGQIQNALELLEMAYG
ncbi:MAG: hypothetical protein AAF541_03740 [Pseudomonadota bacterium]